MTLRLRLLLVLLGIVAAGLIAADVATYTSLRSYLLSQVDQQLQTTPAPVARALWACWTEQQTTGPFPGPSSGGSCQLRINESGQIPAGTFGQLRDPNGNVLIGACFFTGNRASAAPGLPASLPVSGDVQRASIFRVTGTGCAPSSYRGIALTTGIGVASQPSLVVVAAVPLSGVDHTLGRLQLIEMLVTIAVLAALAALAWWIVRRGLRPLDEMTSTAGAIAAGDLSRRVADVDTRTEVGKLGVALNTMLSEIERAFADRKASEDRLRRFLADASHELRTPLASIRGYAELFDRGARDRPEDLATSMRHIREDASRMGILVDDLLLLARLDQQRPLAQENVDLAAVAESAVDAARVAAEDRTITLDSPRTAPMLGDPDRLRQVLDNLLANALRHTPPGTPVEVRVHAEPSSVGVEVADQGPGIAPDERERVFEPFHRADPSRARASGGVGLGLAIVAAIAHAHGGRVGVAPNTPEGARFWVQIPRPVVPNPAPPADGPSHRRAQPASEVRPASQV